MFLSNPFVCSAFNAFKFKIILKFFRLIYTIDLLCNIEKNTGFKCLELLEI